MSWAGRWWALAAAILLGLTLVGFGGWWLTGGRWYVMSTPSMSPRLPVGTLVLTRPLTGEPEVGHIYAFTPPGQTLTFIHEVVGGNPVSGFHTKGYLNGTEDPWTITRVNIQAVAVAWLPDAGWALLSLPVWVLLAALAWGLSRAVSPEWGKRFGGLAIGLGLTIPVLLWGFLINGEVVASVATRGLVRLYVVSTGILPASVVVRGHYLGDLAAGHAHAFVVKVAHAGQPVLLDLRAALPWWGWVLLVLACASPLLWAIGHIRAGPDGAPQVRLGERRATVVSAAAPSSPATSVGLRR
ncbi:MAG TPA: S24/S26 family peptidase [Candidatus Nanopelagicaceae bacterium]|nr:S24/S26 family peptidase [Candidatus Nanopelagicaceae bacterium]